MIFSDGLSTYNPQMTEGEPWRKKGGENRAKQYGSIGAMNRESDGGRYPRSVVMFQNGNNNNDGHPTQKPIALYAYLIRTYTNPGDTVLDFTCGSGTTGVACIKTGRNFIGCEIDPTYFAVAQKRISEAAMQLPLLEVQP